MDVENQRQIELRADYSYPSGITEISADNRFLLAVNDNAVKVWDLPSGSLRHAMFPPKAIFDGAQFRRTVRCLSLDMETIMKCAASVLVR